jgi:hypothetical protein
LGSVQKNITESRRLPSGNEPLSRRFVVRIDGHLATSAQKVPMEISFSQGLEENCQVATITHSILAVQKNA